MLQYTYTEEYLTLERYNGVTGNRLSLNRFVHVRKIMLHGF
jgi:hypothetical protein